MDALKRLERQSQHRATWEQNWDQDSFMVSPTCPPTTNLYVRGGVFGTALWYGSGTTMFMAPTTWDIANPRGTYANVEFAFSAPYRFMPFWVLYQIAYNDDEGYYPVPWFFNVYQWTDGNWYVSRGLTLVDWQDYATAEEAEMALDAGLKDGVGVWGGTPLTGLVLRNNGNIDLPRQFMPIDPVNRGRSYLYRKDIRRKQII